MQIEDFHKDEARFVADPWAKDPWEGTDTTVSVFRHELLSELRGGPLPGDDDLETAITLTRLVRGELEAFGTGGGEQFDEDQIEAAQRCLRVVLERQGINFKFPWRNFAGFRAYWLQNDGYGSWQARRDILETLFRPVHDELDRLEDAQFQAVVAEAVSPHGGTGWPSVDTELHELKRRFRTATTPQDYRDVGNRAVAVLEALSRTVYDPDRHLREGETVLPPDKTKARLGRYVEDSLVGSENAEVRGVTNKVIELAHKVKHAPAPSRRNAGIAADSVILLANILRRVDQEF